MTGKLARILACAAGLSTTAVPLVAQRAATRPARPNIVYIMADDLGWAELGAYGQQKIHTPVLDQLAREGIRFTQFYSGSPVCAPSRSALLTGLHSGHTPIRGNAEYGGYLDSEERGQHPLPLGTPTIASVLKTRGYATALVGKWGLGGPQTSGIPTNFGFDFFYGYLDQKQAHNHYPSHLWRNTQWDTLQPYFAPHQRLASVPADPSVYSQFQGTVYAPDRMTDEAVAFIRRNASQPFFLYLAFTLPHLALQVPDEELAAYDFPETPYLGQNGYLPHPRPRAAYAGMISRLDKHVGQVLAVLRELHIDSTTLVVFTSDNGTTYTGGVDQAFFNSVGPFRGLKDAVFEGGIREPFIARWPGRIAPNTVSKAVAANWDVLPTVAELTGAKVAHRIDGRSFAPALFGRPLPPHAPLYWEHHGVCAGQQAVRDGKWKLVRLGVGARTPLAPMLFDLDADPGERHDLAAQQPAVVKRLMAVIARERTTAILPAWNFPVDSARVVNYTSCAPGGRIN
jgi:arylsulfatase A-like enzyme